MKVQSGLKKITLFRFTTLNEASCARVYLEETVRLGKDTWINFEIRGRWEYSITII